MQSIQRMQLARLKKILVTDLYPGDRRVSMRQRRTADG